MEYLLPPTSWPGAQLDARYTKIPRSPSQSWQSSPGPPHSPRFYSPTPALTKAAPSPPTLPPQLLPSLATCWVILYNLINNRSPFLFSLSPTTLRSGSFRNKLPHCYQTSPNPGNPISLSSLSTPIWGLTLRFHLMLNLKAGNLWELNRGWGLLKAEWNSGTQGQGRMVPRPMLESSLLLFRAEVQVLPTPKGSDQLFSLTVHENQIQGLFNMFPRWLGPLRNQKSSVYTQILTHWEPRQHIQLGCCHQLVPN